MIIIQEIIKKMNLYGINYGGFGNAIFNKLACIILFLLFNEEKFEAEFIHLLSFDTLEEIEQYKCESIHINDESFIEMVIAKIDRNETKVDFNQSYLLTGYYQFDVIYVRYKTQIVDYILAHPQEKIYAAHTKNMYAISEILLPLSKSEPSENECILHLRLGDFVRLGWVLHPDCIRKVVEEYLLQVSRLEQPKENKITILVDYLETEIEHRYVAYIQKIFPNIIIEHQDLLTDYHRMQNAKWIICSCSTLSWAATIFAREDQHVFFPNYEHRWNHEQFRSIHDRWTMYEMTRISEEDLHVLLL